MNDFTVFSALFFLFAVGVMPFLRLRDQLFCILLCACILSLSVIYDWLILGLDLKSAIALQGSWKTRGIFALTAGAVVGLSIFFIIHAIKIINIKISSFYHKFR